MAGRFANSAGASGGGLRTCLSLAAEGVETVAFFAGLLERFPALPLVAQAVLAEVFGPGRRMREPARRRGKVRGPGERGYAGERW